MTQRKTGQPPAQRTRDKQGRFIKGDGVCGNPKGRPKLRDEFKQFAQEKSVESLKVVYELMISALVCHRDRIAAARLLMEYGYGRPATEYDRERLELDLQKYKDEKEQREAGDRPKVIKVIYEDMNMTPEQLEELSK